MLPCVWLLISDLVTSLTTDNNGDAREEDHATHGSNKSKLTLDFLMTLHGTLLVIVVGGGRNDPCWLRVHDDDDDDDDD